MAHRSLDQLDRKILRLIAEDARIPFLEVAREWGFYSLVCFVLLLGR